MQEFELLLTEALHKYNYKSRRFCVSCSTDAGMQSQPSAPKQARHLIRIVIGHTELIIANQHILICYSTSFVHFINLQTFMKWNAYECFVDFSEVAYTAESGVEQMQKHCMMPGRLPTSKQSNGSSELPNQKQFTYAHIAVTAIMVSLPTIALVLGQLLPDLFPPPCWYKSWNCIVCVTVPTFSSSEAELSELFVDN